MWHPGAGVRGRFCAVPAKLRAGLFSLDGKLNRIIFLAFTDRLTHSVWAGSLGSGEGWWKGLDWR